MELPGSLHVYVRVQGQGSEQISGTSEVGAGPLCCFPAGNHGELGDLATLSRVFPDCLAVASFGNHPGVGGVAIIYKKYLHKVFSVAAPVVVEQGRCIILQLSGPSGFVYLANIHINPNHPPNTKISLIADTLSQLPQSMDSVVILGGDFNFESKDCHRMDFIHGKEVPSYSPEAEYFFDKATGYVEIAQPNFTRIGMEAQESGAKVAVSGGVLDHFFIFADPMELLYHKPHTHTIHNIYKPDRLSDHSALSLLLHTHSPTHLPTSHHGFTNTPFSLEPSTSHSLLQNPLLVPIRI